MSRTVRPSARSARALAVAALACVVVLPAPAPAAPVAPSATLPAELARDGETLTVTRRKAFLMRRGGIGRMRATDGVLVFAPFTVNDYGASWTVSQSRTSGRGDAEAYAMESSRSYSFALVGGTAPVLADCDEQMSARGERGGDRPLVDHELRCTLQPQVGGAFQLSVANGRGELAGTGGERLAVTTLVPRASRWEESDTSTLLVRGSSGAPLAAVDLYGKGSVVLLRDLEPARRELLAAAAAAIFLADLDGQ
jgi:hypothetical protein